MVTTQLVKLVSRAALPQMRGIDGLKGNSPLGIEPKGDGIQGQTGYKVSGQNDETPKPAAPAKVEEPKTKTVEAGATSSTGEVSSIRSTNPALPVAKAVKLDFNPEPIRP